MSPVEPEGVLCAFLSEMLSPEPWAFSPEITETRRTVSIHVKANHSHNTQLYTIDIYVYEHTKQTMPTSTSKHRDVQTCTQPKTRN